MPTVHPMSVVDPSAELAEDVFVGPFCLIGPHVRVGAGCRLLSHVTLTGHTVLGDGNVMHPGCVLGGPPQDLKWKGEPTRLEVGDRNVFREGVTVNVGTVQDPVSKGTTRLGNQNLLMANSHVGHDCQIGSGCVIANNVMIAGHVHVGDRVIMNGGVGLHHFVSVGDFAYLAGAARIHFDVPPFVKVADDDVIKALNKLGLRRAGRSEQEIAELQMAFRRLFVRRGMPMAEALRGFHLDNGVHPDVKRMVQAVERRATVKNGRYLESLRTAK
jgi:UDP-N-acetylglucosamine acyltransferase